MRSWRRNPGLRHKMTPVRPLCGNFFWTYSQTNVWLFTHLDFWPRKPWLVWLISCLYGLKSIAWWYIRNGLEAIVSGWEEMGFADLSSTCGLLSFCWFCELDKYQINKDTLKTSSYLLILLFNGPLESQNESPSDVFFRHLLNVPNGRRKEILTAFKVWSYKENLRRAVLLMGRNK